MMADTRVRIARLVEGPAAEMHRFSPFRPASGYLMVATFAGQSRFGLLAENLGHCGVHPTTRIYEVILRPTDGGEPQSGGHFTPMPGGFANVGGALPHGDWLGTPDIDVFVVPMAGPGEEPPVLLHGRLQRVPLPLPRPVIPALTSTEAAPTPAGEAPDATAETASAETPSASPPLLEADTTVHPLNAALYGLSSPDLDPHPAGGLPWDALVGMAPAAANSSGQAAPAEATAPVEPEVPQSPEPAEAPPSEDDEAPSLVAVMAGGQPETLAPEAVTSAAPATDTPVTDAPATDTPATDAPEASADPVTPSAIDAPAPDAPATDAPEALADPATPSATDASAPEAPALDAPEAPADPVTPSATDAPASAAAEPDPPPAPSPDAPLTGGTTHSLTVSVVLQPVDSRATRARGSVVLDYVNGGVLVTARGLGAPGALVGAGSQRLALYRVWLHSEKTRLYFPLGACQRIAADTYRLETPSKVKLTQFERVLLSAEPEGSTPSRTGPSGPTLLAGTYRT